MVINSTFWRGKRVLITGHTGFKDGWLTLWLKQLGADITGLALPPNTQPNLFTLARVADGIVSHFCDIRAVDRVKQHIFAARPQAIRPWQHVLEPLAGYLTLAEKLWQQPELAGADARALCEAEIAAYS